MTTTITDAPILDVIRQYAAQHFDHPVENIVVKKLAGDASTRQYYRAILSGGRTCVVARYPERLDASDHPTCQATQLFLEAGLPVPLIHHVDEQNSLMLLDDLGDLRLQDWLESADAQMCRNAYQRAIDLIVQIQDATPLAQAMGTLPSQLAFDEEKLGWELGFFYENFFVKYQGRDISPSQREKVFEELSTIARELASLPRALCHRDYHSRNLMLCHDTLFIIDHQDARMGPVSYDLASLLGDPYVELGNDFSEEMYHYFLTRRTEKGHSLFTQEWAAGFDREYQLMLVQRLLKATGTYSYQMAVLGNSVYLPYIPKALERALTAIKYLKRFPTIRSMIEQP